MMKIFWKIVQCLVLVGFMIVFVFVMNSYRYLIYALMGAFALYFPLRKIIIGKLSNLDGSRKAQYEVNGRPVNMQMSKLSAFVVLLVLIYVIIVTVFSMSPYLERKEFSVTHSSWVAVTPSILKFVCEFQGGRTKYAYLDLEYQFTADGQSYGKKIVKAEKLYSFFPIWGKRGPEQMQIELLNRVTQKNIAKEPVLYYNPNDPTQHKFFLANDRFYPQGVMLYNLLFVFSIVFLIIVLTAVLFNIKL
ncbi:hypothetical protein [Sphingobacterium puteale]|nr:hypothetical protein [Sphingobacterium puteale]